ncbi:hypothetical protein BST61_g10371 [Cercospora zeina]
MVKLAILTLLAHPALSQTATYQTSSAASVQVQTTITGLASVSLEGLAASVVSADSCNTTLAMQCTDQNICGATGLQIMMTQGPSHYAVAYSTSMFGGGLNASQRQRLIPVHQRHGTTVSWSDEPAESVLETSFSVVLRPVILRTKHDTSGSG